MDIEAQAVHFTDDTQWTSVFLTLAALLALLRALNWNTDNKFPSYAYIQQAIVASNIYPNRNVVVKGVNVPNGFHMEIYIHNSANQDMELISRFGIDELRRGRKKVEMFNLIIMTEVFQTWFLDEFQANLPLPLIKKTGTDQQFFSEPTTQVELLYPPTALQEPPEPPQDVALPGQPNLAVRVLTLETLVADLQERLARLET